jgi:hypothetical protein
MQALERQKKKANAMLYEHMEKQRCSTITKYLFVLQEWANVLAVEKQGIVKLD